MGPWWRDLGFEALDFDEIPTFSEGNRHHRRDPIGNQQGSFDNMHSMLKFEVRS